MIGMVAIMRDVTRRFEEMRALKRKLAELAEASIEKALTVRAKNFDCKMHLYIDYVLRLC